MASEAAEREYYVDKIQDNGYVSAEFGIQPPKFEALFDATDELFEEAFSNNDHGDDVVKSLEYEVPGRPFDSRAFIEKRKAGQVGRNEIGRAPATESKRILQISPYTAAHAREYMRIRGGTSRAMDRVLDITTEIRDETDKCLEQVLGRLGLSEYLLLEPDSTLKRVALLRILDYPGDGDEDNPFIAKDDRAELHLDRSLITVAISEDGPGLVGAPGRNAFGDPNLRLSDLAEMSERALATPLTYYPGWVKIFLGGKIYHIPPDIQEACGNPSPFLHGVRNVNPGKRRRAVVSFENQHTGYNSWGTPTSRETGFSEICKEVEDRESRHGGLVAS